MEAYSKLLSMVFLLLMFVGCASLLPSSKITIISPWQDFGSAKADYEKIIPGQTTLEELNKIGFSPYTVPNIRILNATDTINIFMQNPSMRIENLDPGVQKCLEVKARCTSYRIEPSILDSKRVGNFWLDLLTFKRHTVVTGWEFRGLIIIVDNVVVYKDPIGGRPTVHTEEMVNKPLGPLQDASSDIIPVSRSLFF
ncbi:MAG: hypothetical protein ACYC5X_15620 [Syntrophales bacterium]